MAAATYEQDETRAGESYAGELTLRPVDRDPATFALAGDLDQSTYPVLERVLERVVEGGSGPVYLDFHDVSLVDSMAARAMYHRWRELRAQGRDLVIREASDWVRKVLRILQVEEFLVEPTSR